MDAYNYRDVLGIAGAFHTGSYMEGHTITFLKTLYTLEIMKLPKTRNTHCPTCNKHTEHKIIEGKKKTRGTAHPLSRGSKKRIKSRGHMGIGNHGKYSKPAITKWRMAGRKTSKKVDLRFLCKDCKKMHSISGGGFRARRIEFV